MESICCAVYIEEDSHGHDLYELGGHLCPNKAYKSCMAVLIHCIRAPYDSAARSHVRFFEFLHQLEWDFLLMEEFLNHAVPGLVEGFIHGEHGE